MDYPSGAWVAAVEFRDFIQNTALIDFPLFGRKFTWFQPNGPAMSRLDRILVSDNWFEFWGNGSLWALERDISDHYPLVLRYTGGEWGPKPFRFNNHCIDHRDFNDLVRRTWNDSHLTGWMGFRLKEKLKRLKTTLKQWNKDTYGDVDLKIHGSGASIKSLDLKGEDGDLSQKEMSKRKDNSAQLRHLLKSKDRLAFQRSKSRWLKEWDTNSLFFSSLY